jgi:uncharacterized protein (TIGR03086 family)
MDGISALERSYDQLGKLVATLALDQMALATPCPEWDVRAMLNHIFGTGWTFTFVNQDQTEGEGAGDNVGDDPVSALAQLSTANVASWRRPGALGGDRVYPFGAFPAEAALMINIGEIALHAWDLARAIGQDAIIDPEVATAVYEFYRQIPIAEYRAQGEFGPEISVPESAAVQDRLLGYLGRR